MILQTDFWLTFWIIYVVFWFSFCLTGIAFAVWVFKDARKRKNAHANAWLLIVLLMGIIGFFIYKILIKRKDDL